LKVVLVVLVKLVDNYVVVVLIGLVQFGALDSQTDEQAARNLVLSNLEAGRDELVVLVDLVPRDLIKHLFVSRLLHHVNHDLANQRKDTQI
jgi:hypothetical protein